MKTLQVMKQLSLLTLSLWVVVIATSQQSMALEMWDASGMENAWNESSSSSSSYSSQWVSELTSRNVSQREKQQMINSTLFVIVQSLDLNWKQDRQALAYRFGIENYTGSRKQNMTIKQGLLDLMIVSSNTTNNTNTNNVSNQSINISSIVMTQTQKNALKNQPLFVVVKAFGLDWRQSRVWIANGLWIVDYVGSSAQNIYIKNALLERIQVQ